MLWSKQFYYYDVDKWLEERGSIRSRPKQPAAATTTGTTCTTPTSSRCRTSGSIPGTPRGTWPSTSGPDAGRRGFRQAATRADAERALPAPQRPDPGLRVELRRRESAGACLVHDLHLPAGQGAAREGGHRVARELLPEAAPELHLVGQPQGSLGNNVFEGGFLGLDNIGVFDRSARCRPAVTSNRPTAPPGWPSSARTCSRSPRNWRWPIRLTSNMALKFVEHFLLIASAMIHAGGDTGMWDEEDGFFYDVLRLPDGQAQRLKVRSMVGLAAALRGHGLRGEAGGERTRRSAERARVSRRASRTDGLHP